MHFLISWFRRPSEPCIDEEEEYEADLNINSRADHYRHNSDNYSDLDNLEEEDEDEDDSDKAEMKEFLRKVRSHGSFKLIMGDSVVEPRRDSKNPLERVANTWMAFSVLPTLAISRILAKQNNF